MPFESQATPITRRHAGKMQEPSRESLGPSPPSCALDDCCFTVGWIAAQIHTHSADWNSPADFVRPHWDFEGCLGRSALWGPWFELEALEDSERCRLAATVEVVERSLQRYGKGPQVYGLVHADFVPENLIEHERASSCSTLMTVAGEPGYSSK
jgi:Ser/Thr protein kinase RdoA (MazF antagonist)